MTIAIPRAALDKYSKVLDIELYKRMVLEQVKPDQIDIYLNRILCAAYLTNERTAGGIIIPQDLKAEDIWQGKASLVLKVGPTAFVDTPEYSFHGLRLEPMDWVTFKVGHASQIEINGYPCRIVADHWIESRVPDPRMVTS